MYVVGNLSFTVIRLRILHQDALFLKGRKLADTCQFLMSAYKCRILHICAHTPKIYFFSVGFPGHFSFNQLLKLAEERYLEKLEAVINKQRKLAIIVLLTRTGCLSRICLLMKSMKDVISHFLHTTLSHLKTRRRNNTILLLFIKSSSAFNTIAH